MYCRITGFVVFASFAALLAVVGPVAAEPPALVSVDVTGTRSGDGRSASAALSADGRYVVFVSQAQDLVADPLPGVSNLYRRDLVTGETVHVSANEPPYDVGWFSGYGVSDDGNRIVYQRGSGPSPFAPTDVFVRDVDDGVTLLVSSDLGGLPAFGRSPQITGSGDLVVFVSSAGDLVVNDGNLSEDVFVRDLDAGVTRLVSVNQTGTASGGTGPAMSADGRFVAFSSSAGDLVAVDGNMLTDAFLHDLSTGTTRLVSRAMGGGGGNDVSEASSISGDGSRVAFVSTATDLLPGAGGIFSADVFVYDVASGELELASVDFAGTGGGDLSSFAVLLSADGTHALFHSIASNLTAETIDAGPNVFVRDLEAGVTTLVSVDASGTMSGNGSSLAVGGRSLSADNRYVVFESSATNLVTGVTYDCLVPLCSQIFRHDLDLGATELLSCAPANGSTGDLSSQNPTQSADGRVAAFGSDAPDLSSLPDLNRATDVFALGMPAPLVNDVPALSPVGLLLLAALLSMFGWRLAGKRRRAEG